MNTKKTIKIHQSSIKAYGIICACILLLFSCAARKYQLATTFIDNENGEHIAKKSIGLQKGKICYITTCEYDYSLTDNRLFDVSTFGNFLGGKFSGSSTYLGGANYGSKIKTTVENYLTVLKTLKNAVNYTPSGFNYELVNQEVFRDKNEELSLDILYETNKPDIIINLTELSFNIDGEANKSTSVSPPRTLFPGGYMSSGEQYDTYSGYILIDYTANWEITTTKENKATNISQSGRYISRNSKFYSLSEEISNSTEKIAREFSEILYKLK